MPVFVILNETCICQSHVWNLAQEKHTTQGSTRSFFFTRTCTCNYICEKTHQFKTAIAKVTEAIAKSHDVNTHTQAHAQTQWWFRILERGTCTGSVVPVCLWQCGSHGVPPPLPLLPTKTQTTSQYPQASEAWMNIPTTTHTYTHMHAHTSHTDTVNQPHIPSKEVELWKMRMSEVSVFLCLFFPLFNHPGLKGHTEFSGDKEACRRGGAATEMSNRLTTYSTWLPSMGNRGGGFSSICLSQSMCMCLLNQEIYRHTFSKCALALQVQALEEKALSLLFWAC